MTAQELLNWLGGFVMEGGRPTVAAIPTPPMSEFWKKIKKDIEPHFYGTMPNAIKDAFPNESQQQLKYRNKIHRSRTKEKLWQAIKDVKRVVMADKMVVQLGNAFQERINSLRFGREQSDFYKFMFDIVYPARVLDPNALLAVVPTKVAVRIEDISQPLGVELVIIASEDIVYKDALLCICKNKQPRAFYPKAASDFVQGANYTSYYYVFTLNSYMELAEQNGQLYIIEYYAHNAGDLGANVLGGLPVTYYDKYQRPYLVYESDFSHAVPSMDDLETLTNQLKSCTATNVFPTRIVQGLDCETCQGEGVLHERDANGRLCYDGGCFLPEELLELDSIELGNPKMVACHTCSGKGTLPMGALDQIVIPANKSSVFKDQQGEIGITSIADKYLAYVSPDISSIQELREQRLLASGEVDEVLNITKPSKYAESGVAKEKDRESKYTALKDISSSMARLIKNTLTGIASYLFVVESQRQTEIAAIRVIEPSTFVIVPIAEAQQEFYSSQESMPMAVRMKKHLNLLSQQYEDDPYLMRIEEIAIHYTDGNYLRTINELSTYKGLGLISSDEAIKALRVRAILDKLIKQNPRLLEQDDAAIYNALDAAFEPILAANQPPSLPEVTM